MELLLVERYLHEHIPLTGSMGVSVDRYDGTSVTLSAPLTPNLNHRNTMFGGSISTLGIIAGWTLLHIKTQELQINARLVIQKSNTDFVAPAKTGCVAVCSLPTVDVWRRFDGALRRRKLSRVDLFAEIFASNSLVGRHHGSYVAIQN